MNHRTFQLVILFTFSLAVLFSFCPSRISAAHRETDSADGSIHVTVDTLPEPASLDSNIIMTISMIHPAESTCDPPQMQRGEYYGSFLIAGTESEPPVIKDGKAASVYRIELTPTEAGEIPLLPILLTCRSDTKEDTSILRIPAGTISVESRFQQGEARLSEITASEPISSPPWRPVLIGFILAVVTAGIILLIHRRRNRTKREQVLSPQERGLRELRKLKEEGIAETDFRLYYIRLTGIVRTFIEETTGIRAPEQTTDEFLRSIEADPRALFSSDLKKDLASFLAFADLVKFAKFEPSRDEREDGYTKAEAVIRHRDFALPIEEEKPQC